MRVTWIHPSWRDLVIEELAAHPADRRAFLEACDLPGVELALSVGGGATGERALPLLAADEDWDALGDAVHRVCCDAAQPELARLLGALDSALASAPTDRAEHEMHGVAETALDTIRRRMERSQAAWDAALLERWLELGDRLPGGGPPRPSLGPSLAAVDPVDADPRDLESVARLDAYLALAEVAGLELDSHAQLLASFVARAQDAPQTLPGAVEPPLERIARLIPALRQRALGVLDARRAAAMDAPPAAWELPAVVGAHSGERRVRRILQDL